MTATDRDRLRRLAAEYAAIANSPALDARREVWRLSNRLEERTVPFHIEDNGSFFQDLTPPLECEDALARQFEAQMLHPITNYRLIDDDRIFPRRFHVNWALSRTSECPELAFRRVADGTGRLLGYETNTPLADLGNSLHKLRPTEFSVDRDATARVVETATEAFGDLLPVRIATRAPASAGTSLAQKAVLFIGMDDFYVAMLDQPENVHRFFDFLAADAARYLDWLDAESLITTDRHEFDCGSGSCVYTDELPRRAMAEGDPVHPEDCWGFIEAQETVGMSPEMYAEFIHPYQLRLGDRYGLINYGCCEPVHAIWPTLQGFANLRKVTVSPWCDQESIAAAVGRKVVMSRKPHPLKLCGSVFDPLDFTNHIQESLTIAENNFIELVFRDTCPLNGGMAERVDEACRILHRLVGR